MPDRPLLLIGQAPCLDWFAARLQRTGAGAGSRRLDAGQGLPDGPMQAIVDNNGFAALLARGDWREVELLDVSGAWFDCLADRDALVRAAGGSYLELAGPMMREGIELGFSLAAGGSAAAYLRARPLLDRLAPGPGIHLRVGEAGAAAFCRLTAEAMENLWLGTVRDALTEQPSPPDWTRLFSQAGRRHEEMLSGLLHAARRWRAKHPPAGKDGQPPFADTLADWLIAGLPLGLEIDRRIAAWLADLQAANPRLH